MKSKVLISKGIICMKLINRFTNEVIATISGSNEIKLLNEKDYELYDGVVREKHTGEMIVNVLDDEEFLYDNKNHQLAFDDGRLVN